jgi:hypothetical protein
MYEYVRNNFDYEPYYGSLKGAQQTLLEKAGNDFDLASLLIALFRVSNIPARYVYGTIEIPIEQAMNWVGVEDERTCANLFASCGVPCTAMLVKGGQIKALRLEHCWVEVWVTYDQYSGRRQTDRNKMWIPLDPSFKQYEYKEGIDFAKEVPFDLESFSNHLENTATVNKTESSVTNIDYNYVHQELGEYAARLKNYIKENMPNATGEDIVGGKKIVKQNFGMLPCILPYKIITVLNKEANFIKKFRYQINFEITSDNLESILNYGISIPELAGKRITISYFPATLADETIAEEYGGILKTPAYLLKLKPFLKIEGETKIIGSEANLGTSQRLKIIFITPGGEQDSIVNDIIVGSYYAIGLDLFKVSSVILERRKKKLERLLEKKQATKDEWLGELLYVTTLGYFYELDALDEITAKCSKVVNVRDISEAMTGIVLDVNFMFQIPRSVTVAGLMMDVDRRINRPFSTKGEKDITKSFMVSSGMLSSTLEAGIYEQMWNVPAVSTIKVLQIANAQGIPIFTISKANFEEVLPLLEVSKEVKGDIVNAVNSGRIVTVPKKNIFYEGYEGVGYIVLDPETGSANYLISGGVSGVKASLKDKEQRAKREMVEIVLNAVKDMLIVIIGAIKQKVAIIVDFITAAIKIVSYLHAKEITGPEAFLLFVAWLTCACISILGGKLIWGVLLPGLGIVNVIILLTVGLTFVYFAAVLYREIEKVILEKEK